MSIQGKFYEDLEVGDRFRTLGRTVTEADLVNFIGVTGLYEEIFQNAEYVVKETPYGRRIAPGALTYSFAEGLLVQSGLIHGTGLAFLGMELKILGPVAIGDTIHVEVEITEKRPTSRPDRGIVKSLNRVVNQRGEVVMEFTPIRLIRRRPAEA